MTTQYKLLNHSNFFLDPTLLPIAVLKIGTGMHIPFDLANTDYQEYLAWLAEGNTPLPAEES
jgi:hypothetical protein